MTSPARHPRLRLTAVLALALCTAVFAPAAAVGKKKAKKGPSAVNITKVVGAPVPDAAPGPNGPVGVLNSTIDVGSQFRGKRIRDVDVTVQLTGAGPSANSVGDIWARLIAPNGASTTLFFPFLGPGNLVGPLTLTDESLLSLGSGTPDEFTVTLWAPYQGSARPSGNPLWVMDNGPAQGTWTLRLLDFFNTDTTVLNSWALKVAVGNPFLTK